MEIGELISYLLQSVQILQKIRPEDYHSLGPSSVKIYYVSDSVPF